MKSVLRLPNKDRDAAWIPRGEIHELGREVLLLVSVSAVISVGVDESELSVAYHEVTCVSASPATPDRGEVKVK